MNKYLKLILGLTIAMVLLAYFWFGRQSSRLCKGHCANSLVVGVAAGYAPFVSVNPQGEYEGFDIDVANALAREMDKKLVLQDLGSMSALFTALNQGKIDIIMWGMSITPARLQKVAMVHYAGEPTQSYPLLFWEKIPTHVKSLADLAGQTVCVEPSSAQEVILDQYDQINKLPVEKIDDALLNLQYNKAVAALVESAIARKFKAKYPQIQILDLPLAQENQEQGIGIVIRPKDKLLIRQVQDAVQTLKDSQIIAQFSKKWGII